MLDTDEEVEITDFHKVNKNNFQQIENKANKIGYADGVNDGRESVFQSGFDQGYKDGLRTAFDLEKFRSFFQNLNTDKIKDNELVKEKQQYHELDIPPAKSQQHFKYLNHTDESLTVVSQKQHIYIDEIMNKCAQTMPKATDLLKVVPSTSTDFM